MTRHIETLVDTVKTCLSNPDATIRQCIRPTTHDLATIWKWNHILPPLYDFGMHEVVSKKAQRFPDKVAVSSWDGDLTYSEVDLYSTHIACCLRDMGVQLQDTLPLCFEKSRWTVVAVLAVMKAGATFVLMDPTLPLARLSNMAEQVGAKMMLTSRKQHTLGESIMPSEKIMIVEANTFNNRYELKVVQSLAPVPSSILMYIIFTSGSTGTPKGVKISHETYTSSAIPRANAVGYTENSSVLDFASYAFDVSIDSMLLTLGNGGRLCIPSDEDRMNDINGVIRKMKVNYAGLTPSVARILDPDVIASLSGLGLGGEAVSARDVALWGKDTRIIIGYGPCECTIGCTINSSAATGRDYISIGVGNGAAIWIADPNDHELLMPVGAVGELLVEGPIVGQGYLKDPDKTAAAFIENPSWLLAGHVGFPGRQGRLYKTGDLGKYDPDGSGGIIFVGRKDTQVKLRGQRVELGEIESQLKARLPSDISVIAEVIIPPGSGTQPTLVAFISDRFTKSYGQIDIHVKELPTEIYKTLSKANLDLTNFLPRYMIPTAYIPVDSIPLLVSGKTDRKRLRQFGATVDLRQLDQCTASRTAVQLSDLEQRLQQIWSQVLKVDQQGIRTSDNFFVLGGNSLMAMRLASICRIQGLELTVASTFNHPTLKDMASVLRVGSSVKRMEISAFSMISQTTELARLEASRTCGSVHSSIQDIYPCTPTQESLFTFSLKSPKPYIAQRVACIPDSISLDAWMKAWEAVVAAQPVLRTRLAQLEEPGLMQIVLEENIFWKYSNKLAEYLENDRNERMELGQSLARYAIINDSGDGKRYMVWTVHHVLYDGWSEPLVLQMVSDILQGQCKMAQAAMRDFVKYVRDTDVESMHGFWRRELEGAVGPQFPSLPSRDFLPTPDAMVERQIPLELNAGLSFTVATLIRGAWALVASQYTGNDDVVFGETLMGRDIPIPGVEGIVGPMIATLPVRIRINREMTVESYLRTVQQSMLARTPYQHMGMQNIRKVSSDAQYACEASTGLVIQPEPEYSGSELGFEPGDVVQEALHFNPYPLMLACGVQNSGFRICANFDSGLIETEQMRRILAQLEKVCFEMTKDISRRIGEISCLPETELDQIWQQNQIPPLTLEEPTGKLRANISMKKGMIYPPAVVPWVCNLQNPSLLSPIGCVGELWLEGAFLSGKTIETPAWLKAGSGAHVGRTGRVQPTGDIVQLREDGSLTFVGRKESIVSDHGHLIDTANLEAHVSQRLPEGIKIAAVPVSPSQHDSPEQIQKQKLVIFIEHRLSAEKTIELLPAKYDLSSDPSRPLGFKTTICATVPISLVAALKKLHKFIEDTLPSYMVPFAYVMVDIIPATTGHIDRTSLNRFASKIPLEVLTMIHEGLHATWAQSLDQAELTIEENLLRSSWAEILGIDQAQIGAEDNFFRLGGDSVLAMKLVSSLRMKGHSLTVADIFQHMRLSDMASVFKPGDMPQTKVQPYSAFSTLGIPDVDSFISDIVRPKLTNQHSLIQDVLPVTDSQMLDVRATIRTPRTSVQYTVLHFSKWLDRERLLRACDELVKAHNILRTVFIEHEGQAFQVVMDQVDVSTVVHRMNGDLEQYVANLCMEDIKSDFSWGSSFMKIFHIEGDNGQHSLIMRLSHAQYDGVSLPRLLRDLELLYSERKLTSIEPFSSYMARIHDEQTEKQALNYWPNLLSGSSLSILDRTCLQPTGKSIFRKRSVDTSLRPTEITLANLLAASWALVLARRLCTPDVTFGIVTSGRNMELANVENIMGPCYQFTPVRVSIASHWRARDLLHFVQRQTAESAAYDFLGFERISKRCTQWQPEATFFDSIVHYQDFEDFDSMPFAGETCKVDILNPHGDASHPLKVVSFVRDGQTSFGIVGSESEIAFVDDILNELVAAVQEMMTYGSGNMLLDNVHR